MPDPVSDIYTDDVKDAAAWPFHKGRLPDATHTHEEKNPLCGDVIRIDLKIDDKGNIEEAYFDGDGCIISRAAASFLMEEMQGKHIDDVKHFSAEDMLTLFGPKLMPQRQKCCLLSWKVLQSAVHSPVGEGS